MKYTSVSVHQNEKLKGRPWQARGKYKDANGKWKEISKVFREAKGKREAKRMADEWIAALNAEAERQPNTDKGKTLDETLKEYLRFQLDTGEIEKSTYSNSIHSYNKYIKPYLGDYIFVSIDKTVINSWLTKLYKLGLSQNTIHTTYARLKKVYNYYYKSGELEADPFKGVKMPKKGEAKVTHLTDEQMEQVRQAVYNTLKPEDPMYIGILLALYAGLRRGEICGLRWNDLDFDKHTITIRSAVGVSSTNEEGLAGDYTKSPKNKSSNRTFPLDPILEKDLLLRKEKIQPKGNWFVTGEEDTFMRPQLFNRKFSEFVEFHNLVDAYGKKLIPHGLRHNLATVGIRAGVDIASLSVIMGHASRAMTLDTYGDANADALILAGVKLSEQFKEKSELSQVIEQAYQEQSETENTQEE